MCVATSVPSYEEYLKRLFSYHTEAVDLQGQQQHMLLISGHIQRQMTECWGCVKIKRGNGEEILTYINYEPDLTKYIKIKKLKWTGDTNG
jgi:hypothetical protein